MTEKEVTLVLPLQGENSLLRVAMGIKQTKPGKGLWNGFGGKLKLGETPEQAAVREVEEEVGLVAEVEDLVKVAFIDFYMDDEHTFSCHVYCLRDWEGSLLDSEEMKGCRFHITERLPKEMWPADHEWMSIVFEGCKMKACIYYKSDDAHYYRLKYEIVDSL